MFQSLFLLVQLHLKKPLIYTKISFIKLMFNFLFAGGHVDQIPKISGCQAKLPAVICWNASTALSTAMVELQSNFCILDLLKRPVN